MECFGLPQLKTDYEWPTTDDLNHFPFRRIKLNGVAWKSVDECPLSSIQLKFTNGIDSPLFETAKGPELSLNHEMIDDTQKIASVRMKI